MIAVQHGLSSPNTGNLTNHDILRVFQYLGELDSFFLNATQGAPFCHFTSQLRFVTYS
jgi:hypothetical protein